MPSSINYLALLILTIIVTETFYIVALYYNLILISNQEKLKGSLPLAAIDTVEKLPEDSNSLKITGPFKHPLVLQASGKEECQDWIKAIENGETAYQRLLLLQRL